MNVGENMGEVSGGVVDWRLGRTGGGPGGWRRRSQFNSKLALAALASSSFPTRPQSTP